MRNPAPIVSHLVRGMSHFYVLYVARLQSCELFIAFHSRDSFGA